MRTENIMCDPGETTGVVCAEFAEISKNIQG